MNWKSGELTPKTGATSVKAARKTPKQCRIDELLCGNLDLSNHEGDRVGAIVVFGCIDHARRTQPEARGLGVVSDHI